MVSTKFDGAAFAARVEDLTAAIAQTRELCAGSKVLIERAKQPGAARPVKVPTEDAFAAFSNLLSSRGIREALAYLGGLSSYRFISIFRFEGGMATSAVHFDRSDPSVLQAAEVPDTATYCCFVRDGNGAFVTADAMVDPRAEGHPARQAIPAYCGIPIMDAEGGLIGTLCHYDVQARDPEELDLELLLQVASALAQSGLVPPYPSKP